MQNFTESSLLLFVLLNPFLMSIYLLDLIESLEARVFRRVLIRGASISALVFVFFAFVGEAFFTNVLQVRFASFLLFGGTVFFVIAIRYVLIGADAIRSIRGRPEHVAGSIAMPFMIGPGTVSASVLAGSRNPLPVAVLAIFTALAATVTCVLLLKRLHDAVRRSNEPLVERYIDLVGRLSALLIGTIAIEMILHGIELWRTELLGSADMPAGSPRR